VPPGELVEGFTRSRDDSGNVFTDLLRGKLDRSYAPPDRFELDLNDPTPFQVNTCAQLRQEDMLHDCYTPMPPVPSSPRVTPGAF
jgi:hypothetical protein